MEARDGPPVAPPIEIEGATTEGIERPGRVDIPGSSILPPLDFMPVAPENAFWLSASELWRSWLAIVEFTYCIRFAMVCMSTESLCCEPVELPWLALSRLDKVLALIEAPLLPTARLWRRALRDGVTSLGFEAASPLSVTSVEAAPW